MIIDTEGNHLEAKPYANEDELQKHIFEHPELLSESNDDKYISIAREVKIDSGRIDVLMLSHTGNIVVVEVKLDRNQQSRREIVAQIVDYVSTLSELSIYELNDRTNHKLLDKLEEAEIPPETADKLLRNADIEVILAVDQSNEDLNRIVQFLSAHTDFKISLAEISKHNDGDRTLLSSSLLFSKEDSAPKKSSESHDHTRSELMDRIAAAWNECPFAKEHSLFTHGNNATFRQILVPGWKSTLHYEFTFVRNTLYVRLDNELNPSDPNKSVIREAMKTFSGKIIGGKPIVVRNNQLYLAPFDPSDLNTLVSTMSQLISLTKTIIDGVTEFSRRSATTFAMLGIPVGSKLHCLKDPSIIATTADDKNQIIDMNGQKRTISNYSNEIIGSPTSGFEYFTYNGQRLIDIRNTNEQTNGEK
jgi:hypothetical protein